MTIKEFGLTIPYMGVYDDDFDVMGRMDFEIALSMLTAQHPRRARQWREASDGYGKWLAALYPPHPTAACETCGQALPDYPDDD